jgi:hypothetical protein
VTDGFEALKRKYSTKQKYKPIFSVPSRSSKSAKGPALKTEESTFGKILDLLSRTSYGANKAIIASLKKENPFPAYWRGLKGERTTGSDVIQQIRGGKAPKTRLGKMAQGVGGFAADVFNPLDLLNWVGIGTATKLAKGARVIPSLAKGLQTGERTLLRLGPATTRHLGVIDRPVGAFLEEAGKRVSNLPGASKLREAFAPAFTALRTQSNKVLSGTRRLFSGEAGKVTSQTGDIGKAWKSALKSVKSGEFEKINPKQMAWYKKNNYTPEQIVGKEIRRYLNAPLKAMQGKNGIKVLKVMGEKGRAKTVREVLKGVVAEGPTTKPIALISSAFKQSLGRLGELKKARKIDGKLLGYDPRPLSREMREIFGDKYVAGGERVLKEFTTEQVEELARNPKTRELFFSKTLGTKNLEAKAGFLDALKAKSPKMASFYEDDMIKSFDRHLNRVAQEVTTADAVLDIAKNPSLARTTRQAWGETQERVREVVIPDKYKKMLSASINDPSFNKKTLFMKDEVAKEFEKFVEVMGDPRAVNAFIGEAEGAYRKMLGFWKQWTLYGTPLVATPTILRNFYGNNFLSWFRGAWSASGMADAFKALPLLFKSRFSKEFLNNPARFDEELSKLGDLGQDIKYLAENNAFNEGFTKDIFRETPSIRNTAMGRVEKVLGVEASGKANDLAESFSRVQHFRTRLKDGWSREAALKDVRDTLYDYVGGATGKIDPLAADIIPFWRWMRFNVPAMIVQTIKHPGKAASVQHIKDNIERTTGLQTDGTAPDERSLPEYIKGDLSIRLWQDEKTGKWTYMRLKGFAPIADIEDVVTPKRIGEALMAGLTPAAKIPLEAKFNKSLFFKTAGGKMADIENYQGERGKFLKIDMRKRDINLLRNFRLLNEANRALSAFAPEKGRPALSPAEYGIRMAGTTMVPVDVEQAKEQARNAYRKQLSSLKAARTRELFRRGETKRVDKLIEELKRSSY